MGDKTLGVPKSLDDKNSNGHDLSGTCKCLRDNFGWTYSVDVEVIEDNSDIRVVGQMINQLLKSSAKNRKMTISERKEVCILHEKQIETSTIWKKPRYT